MIREIVMRALSLLAPSEAALGLLHRAGRPYARRLVDTPGGPVAYAEAGSGPHVVVALHGTLTVLDDMLLALDGRLDGFRLIAFDRPGFGATGRRLLADAGVLRQARRLNHALDALNVGRAVLLGHSFGAAVATAMAMLAPKRALGVVALAPLVMPEVRLEHVLFGPRGIPIWGQAYSAVRHGGLDHALLPILWRAMFLPQAMPEAAAASLPFNLAGEAGATSRVGEDCLAAGPDLIAILANAPLLQKPVEVLGGGADLVINNALHGQMLAALAPRGRFCLLPGVGHMIHHAAPERVARAVAEVMATA
jgi:pimeloyl-ACP methyl ester carboxylesterase